MILAICAASRANGFLLGMVWKKRIEAEKHMKKIKTKAAI